MVCFGGSLFRRLQFLQEFGFSHKENLQVSSKSDQLMLLQLSPLQLETSRGTENCLRYF